MSELHAARTHLSQQHLFFTLLGPHDGLPTLLKGLLDCFPTATLTIHDVVKVLTTLSLDLEGGVSAVIWQALEVYLVQLLLGKVYWI